MKKKKKYELPDEHDIKNTLSVVKDDLAVYEARIKRDILDDLTPDQVESLSIALDQLERGEIVTHEEVMKEAKLWLKR